MIYVIAESGEVDGPVKIGVTESRTPLDRLASLQAGTWRELEVIAAAPGDRRREQELHSQFGDFRIRGEWFRRGEPVARFIAENAIGPLRAPRRSVARKARTIEEAEAWLATRPREAAACPHGPMRLEWVRLLQEEEHLLREMAARGVALPDVTEPKETDS